MIRKASQNDLASIFELYQSLALDRKKLSNTDYQTSVQTGGFLLGLENENDIKKLIDEACMFLVYEDEGEILGYIIADHRDKYYDDEYKTWFDLEAKEKYYNSPQSMTLATIGVKKDKNKKGIATSLLKELQNILRKNNYKYFFSIVTIAPITNIPSIVFHTKNGFQRIAMGRPRKLFDLDNYSAILFYKPI